ncbi:MAG: LamG domain-containing protein [Nitrososphaerota archaeon]
MDKPQETASSTEPSYRRGRDFERWAYPNRTVTLVQYLGPRFVKHYASGEFVDLVFEDHYASEGYYLVQNAYIGLKIYDNKTVMYNPDMEYVVVEEESIMVQMCDSVSSLWLDLELDNPSLRVDVNNSTMSRITRTHNGTEGMLEVTYIIRGGELMKNCITFTSFFEEQRLFRVVQRLTGIQSGNVTYETIDGSSETLTVDAPTELVSPFLRFEKGDKPVLTVFLNDLGHRTGGGTWTADKLNEITLDNQTGAINSEIIMGNYSLEPKEALTIDPEYTTSPQILHSYDDTYVQKTQWYYYGWNDPTYDNRKTETLMKFGCDLLYNDWYDYYHLTFRAYMRWPILVPDGADVQSAFLKTRSQGSQTYDFTAEVRTLDFGNCPRFDADLAQTIWSYGVMQTTTNWQITDDWSDGQLISLDITNHVEEFMGRQDYTLGNYMGLRISEGDATYASGNYRKVYSYDEDVDMAPRLEITFTYPDETFVEPIDNWSFEDGSAWSADNLYLRMDEGLGAKAYDSGPYNNDGAIKAHHSTLINMDPSISWVDGKYSKALSFDGVNDYVAVSDTASLKPTYVTVEAWVKLKSGGNNHFDSTPLTKGWTYFACGFENSATPRMVFRLKFVGETWTEVYSDETHPLNTWMHVAYTYDGSYIRMYRNGSLIESYAKSGTIDWEQGRALWIGANNWGGYDFSIIDEVRVYNRALIASEISNRFYGVDVRNGLMAEWKFDEGTGSSAADTHMWTTGRFGMALEFDGVDDYVEVPNSATLQITDDITVEAWIKIDSGGATDQRVILEKAGSYRLMVRHEPYRHLEVWLWLQEDGGAATLVGGDPISYDVWHRVGFTRNKSTGIVKTFVDGVEQASVSGKTSSIPVNTNPVIIGKGWNEFDGVIDEVRISDNKASRTVDSNTYMHGKHSWNVTGSANQDVVVSQLLSKEVVEYIRNRKPNQNRGACFSFWYKPDDVTSNGEKNRAYAEIVYKVGGVWQTPVTGDTVKPDDETKWWHGLVYASLPTNTEAVKVRIVGVPYSGVGFKAWVDLALLSVYYYNSSTNGPYGNATLTTNIYHSTAIQHPEFDGFVSLGFGVAAKAKTGYSIAKLKDLKVELLPNNGTATTQQGRLTILYLTQQNSKNWTMYEWPLERTAIGFDIAGFCIGLAITGLGIVDAIVGPEKVSATLLITTGLDITWNAISGVKLMDNPNSNPLAEGGSYYKVYETLDYSGHLGSLESDRIKYAGAQYYFDWRFRTDSDDVFAVKVSATVQWAKWTWDDYYQRYYWDCTTIYETKLSFIISVADYWQ